MSQTVDEDRSEPDSDRLASQSRKCSDQAEMRLQGAKLAYLLTQAVVTSELCAQTAPSFKPGHFYVPNRDGEVLEFDGELNEVDRFIVKDVVGSTGATFNDRGNFVFIARVRDAGVHVLEVNRQGQVLNDYPTGHSSLFYGSYIDFNAARAQYAFADREQITVIDRDFRFIGSTEEVLERAGGVAFLDDGRIYATDAFEKDLVTFDENFELAHVRWTG